MQLLDSMPPYTLFGVEDCDYERAKVVVLPIPYDSMTSYKPGTRDGPHAIIEASRSMEWFSREFDFDPAKSGVFTTEELAPDFNSPEKMSERVEREVSRILSDGKMPIVLGGDHSVSIGAIRAVAKGGGISVLHFDAHSDSREQYMGSRYSHASVMARAREVCDSCYSVGIRSIDRASSEAYSRTTLFMDEVNSISESEVVKRILANTQGRIYITLDVDVIDPSEMPSTGTPEPDGISYARLRGILREVIKEREVVGMDFVELSPIPGMVAPNYLVAKLIFSCLGYIFAGH